MKNLIRKMFSYISPHRFSQWFWDKEATIDAHQAILTGVPDDSTYELSGRFSLAYLQNHLLLDKGWHVLDYGCGNGRVTRHLVKKVSRVTAADISGKMLSLFAEELKEHHNVQTVHIKTPALGELPNDEYDLIFSMLVLQHMNKSRAKELLHHLSRKVKIGGYLFLQFPSPSIREEFPKLYETINQQDASQPGLARLYTLDEVVDLMTINRLSLLKIELLYGNYYVSVQREAQDVRNDRVELYKPHFEGAIEILEDIQPWPLDSLQTLHCQIRNRGNIAWRNDSDDPLNFVQLAISLLINEEETLIQDFARAALPRVVFPDDTLELEITCPKIEKPGDYYLLVDMVNEGNFWFHQRSNRRFLKRISVS